MTGEVGMAVSQQRTRISNAVLHPNSTTGTLTLSQVLWPADCTYYLQRLRLLTNALMCCTLALLLVWPRKVGSSQFPSLSLPIIYSKAPRGGRYLLTLLKLFQKPCLSSSLSLDTALHPPIVHLLRLRTPLCMTTSPPGTLSEATCIAQTENG